jgi:hypothetical protein
MPLSRRPLLDPLRETLGQALSRRPLLDVGMGVSACQRNNQWASVLGRLSQERTSFEPWFLASLPVEAPYPRYNKAGSGQCWGISSLPFRAPTDRPGARPWTLWPLLPVSRRGACSSRHFCFHWRPSRRPLLDFTRVDSSLELCRGALFSI